MNPGQKVNEFYPEGIEREFVTPEVPLWRLLEGAAKEFSQKTAIYCEGDEISYVRLWRHVRSAAAQLRSRGFGHGKRSDRVLLVLPNGPEFVTYFYAANRADMIAVAANPALTREEMVDVIDEVEPRVAYVAEERAIEFESAIDRARVRPPKVFYVRPGVEYSGRSGDSSLMPKVISPPTPAQTRPLEDVAVLSFTSGTTGGKRAAMLSNRNLVANALQNNMWFKWTGDDVVIGALPLFHSWGMCCVMNATIAAGASMVLFPEINAERVIEAVVANKGTILYGSGTLFDRLLEAAGESAPELFHSLRYVKAGAMLVPRKLNERWLQAVPKVPMINGYGLTEASPEVCNNPPGRVKANTVGIALPGTEIRLCDALKPEKPTSRGEVGEIQVRGPQVMLGYWDDPDATRHSFVKGGWLRTGDLGQFDPDGYLKVVDRLKDVIKFRGYNVVPSEVERVLMTHPSVKEAVVVGIQNSTDGELPVAYVVLEQGAPMDGNDLPEYVKPHLSSFKRPRRYHIVHSIPKNAVGKPLRRVLRELPEPGSARINLPG